MVTEEEMFPSRASWASTPGSAQAWPASSVIAVPPSNSSSGFAVSGLTSLESDTEAHDVAELLGVT